MPVDKLTPEQAEAIRASGVCAETGVRAQWGYHPKDDARVFHLRKGEELPKGWADSPAAFAGKPA